MKKIMSDWELGYLAGVIDGEGSILLVKHKNIRASKGFILRGRLDITNTDYGMISKCSELLDTPIMFYKSK